MDILVGHTGFVGSNIAKMHNFDLLCNSKNISEAFNKSPDLLVYAGVPAEMYFANQNPAADRAVTLAAAENIHRINPKLLVLISTIAVLDNPVNVDEDVVIEADKLTAYGRNRLELEKTVSESVSNCCIVRLPALFGAGIKKNFIYDMINYFPEMLSKSKFEEFASREPAIEASYALQYSGFYKLVVEEGNRDDLRDSFERLGFSAMNFTDNRSAFQFYNLEHLWNHINIAITNSLPLLHAAVEPLIASDVCMYITGKPFDNELPKPPFNYNYQTKHFDLFGGENGYLFDRINVLSEIKEFVEKESSKIND